MKMTMKEKLAVVGKTFPNIMESTAPIREQSKRTVAYFYDNNIGNYHYGPGHVMKPHRIRLAHELILNYGLYRRLDIFRPFPATYKDITRFHNEEYVKFLMKSNPDRLCDSNNQYGVANDDCPLFNGLYEFCQLSCGGSLAAAVKLNKKKADIAINWMGGLHHAKKAEASGFCYTNDIVLGILELLNYHKRVLYVDIDIHHGDGVEEAFYTTDRVMTVSFHKYGDFFPGTGGLQDIGAGMGRLYSVNVPLLDGITDASYQSIFKPVMQKVMERFDPSAIVLQCGADSLSGDRLGGFNLTLNGHGECARFFRSYNVPLMLVGGGGYTPRNVARCWAYETAIAVDMEVPNELPYNACFEYFGPNYRLHIETSNVRNENSSSMLAQLQNDVYANLDQLCFVPSVQMRPIPEDGAAIEDIEAINQDEIDPDKYLPSQVTDRMIQDDGDFFDGEREGDDRRNESSGKAVAERDSSAPSPEY